MTVTLTSPALGQDVGTTYTGSEEEYLLAQGLARRDGYVGPGVSNTGPSAQTPAEDLQLAENREAPPRRFEDGTQDPGPKDPAMVYDGSSEADDFDFDEGGVNTEVPNLEAVEPAEGVAGDVVALTGSNFEGATGVTFDGVAGTDLEVQDNEVLVTVPAGVAGPADVVVTNANGTDTLVGGFTYTA